MDDEIEDVSDFQGNCIEINDYEQCSNYLGEDAGGRLINIFHLNIRSLKKHFDDLSVVLHSINIHNLDLIILSETWGYSEYGMHIPNYQCYFNNSRLNKSDGLVIYINEKIIHTVSHIKDNNFVFTVIKLCIKGKTISILTVYRSPSTNITDFTQSLESNIRDHINGDLCVFLGDINIDLLSENDIRTVEYQNSLASQGFEACHRKPTRATDVSDTCIDHIFVRINKQLKQKINLNTVILQTTITDHYSTILAVSYEDKNRRQETLSQTITKTDKTKLNTFLQNEGWQTVFLHDEPLSCVKVFYEILNKHVESSQRIIKITNKNRKLKPWITNGLVKSIKTRDKLKKQILKHKDDEALQERFKTYRNTLNTLIRSTKEDYYKSKLNEVGNNSRKIWQIMKEITDTPKTNSNLADINITHENITLTENKSKSNAFNKYYTNICDTLCSARDVHPLNQNFKTLERSLFLLPITDSELIQHISSLKANSSYGVDNIPISCIKQNHHLFIPVLKHIFNLIFRTGIIPPEFKHSIITPILKNGDKSNIKNYRPISNISTFAKIFEKCLKKRLVDFFEKYNILSENQFGFRAELSTEDAVYELINKIYNYINNKQKTIAVFLDLQKAFDMVSHEKLLMKLERLGVRGVVLKLFRNYLSGRTQQVKINNTLGDKLEVKRGVPQGTVLGPILFLAYMNDISWGLTSGDLISYADDTVLLFSGSSWNDALRSASAGLSGVSDWLDRNHLLLNLNKTKMMRFAFNELEPMNNDLTIHQNCRSDTCNCPKIQETQTIKYLGVHIDSNMKWVNHSQYLNNVLKNTIHKFYLLRNILKKKTLITVYKSLIESKLRYCNIIWGGLYDEHLKQINVTQRHILKVILKLPRDYPSVQLYSNNNILSTRGLYMVDLLVFVHKRNIYSKIDHSIETRSKQNKLLKVVRCRSTAAQRFISFLGPRLYNFLPRNLKDIGSIRRFKTAVNDYVNNNYFPLSDLLRVQI